MFVNINVSEGFVYKYKHNKMIIYIKEGKFYGTVEDFKRIENLV